MEADRHPFFSGGQYVTADFFPMFGVPFLAGSGWTAAQDQERARVVVLNAELARKLFGDGDAVTATAPSGGRFLLLAGKPLREPIARYGPFVMSTEAEIHQAFADLRAGRLGR